MDILKYKITFKNNTIAIFDFTLEKNIEPADLKTLTLPDPVKENLASKCVVLSGRGPIWLYGVLIHHFHPCKAVAVFDPRLEGAVVVESHSSDFTIGDIIPNKI